MIEIQSGKEKRQGAGDAQRVKHPPFDRGFAEQAEQAPDDRQRKTEKHTREHVKDAKKRKAAQPNDKDRCERSFL